MNTRFALSVLTASFFVGCASQSGSHPKAAQVSSCSVVPTVADPRHIEVNGRAMDERGVFDPLLRGPVRQSHLRHRDRDARVRWSHPRPRIAPSCPHQGEIHEQVDSVSQDSWLRWQVLAKRLPASR